MTKRKIKLLMSAEDSVEFNEIDWYILNDDKIIHLNDKFQGSIYHVGIIENNDQYLEVKYFNSLSNQVCGIIDCYGFVIAKGLIEISQFVAAPEPMFIVLLERDTWEHPYACTLSGGSLYYSIVDANGIFRYEPTERFIEWLEKECGFFINAYQIVPTHNI